MLVIFVVIPNYSPPKRVASVASKRKNANANAPTSLVPKKKKDERIATAAELGNTSAAKRNLAESRAAGLGSSSGSASGELTIMS